MSEKEYIERGALIRALDDHKSKVNWDILETHTNTLIAFVIQQPAADVEPVVRCKDCIAYMGKERKGGGIKLVCGFYKCETSPEHFCAHGKERER